MNLRELNFELELAENMIKPFERKVLESGLCDFAVPMSFFRHNGKQVIRYECSGYISLSEADLSDSTTIFEILEKTLIALQKSGEYLMNPAKIVLNQYTVYIHCLHKDVRIAYMPGMREDGRQHQNLMEFIRFLEDRIPPSGRDSINQLKDEIVLHNRSLSDLINIVGEIRRELFRRESH